MATSLLRLLTTTLTLTTLTACFFFTDPPDSDDYEYGASWTDSDSDQPATGCSDVNGVSRWDAEVGDPCSGGTLADCGAEYGGYPARWQCNMSTCTWQVADVCDSHPDPDCNVCTDMQCFESAAGSCGA